jgi:Tfp pilus assembly protein PilV
MNRQSISHSVRPRKNRPADLPVGRDGATLTEVLMAILIMGIGIVAIATLFPAAVIRSINATKLTNATLLRYNAEAAIDTDPDRLVHNPDRDGTLVNNINPAVNNGFYIVDPLGWELIRQSSGSFATANSFGGLPRYNAFNNRTAAISRTAAEGIVSLPDRWVQQASAPVSSFTPAASATTGPTEVTLTDIKAADLSQIDLGGLSRIILIDANTKQSHVRTITSIAGTTVRWTGAVINFTPAEARIETRTLDYTWFLTVHNNLTAANAVPGSPIRNANVDVVVSFRRTFELSNETVYQVTGAGNTFTLKLASGGTRPLLKKGSFLFDVNNARWHRIAKILNETSLNPIITLQTSVTGTFAFRSAIFMASVVEVYPLELKNTPTN